MNKTLCISMIESFMKVNFPNVKYEVINIDVNHYFKNETVRIKCYKNETEFNVYLFEFYFRDNGFLRSVVMNYDSRMMEVLK